MKYLRILILFTIIVTAGCPQRETRYVPVVTDTEYCEAAEINLSDSCPRYIKPNRRMRENNETFKDFCKRKQNDGIFLNPKCLASAKSCHEADVCNLPIGE